MANIGFSIGDIVTVGTLAWNVYRACSNATSEFQEVAREVVSLHSAVKQLELEASKPDSVIQKAIDSKQKELETLLQNIEQVLHQLDGLVSKYKSLSTNDRKKRDILRFGSKGLENVRSKIILHTSATNLFLGTLSAASLGRIEVKLDEIVGELRNGQRNAAAIAVSDDEDDPTAARQWRTLREELVNEGFRKEEIENHKAWIKAEMRKRISEDQHGQETGNSVIDATLPQTNDLSPYFTGNGDDPAQIQQVQQSKSPWRSPTLTSLPRLTTIDANTPTDMRTKYGTATTSRSYRVDDRNVGDTNVDSRGSPTLRRSLSVSSMNSTHSEVAEYDLYGNLTKKTVTTKTTTYYSLSASEDSAGSGREQPSMDFKTNDSEPRYMQKIHKCVRINPSTNKPCNTIFSRPYDLTRHDDLVHNNRKMKIRCPMCREEKLFSRNDELTRHMRVVHRDLEAYGKRHRKARKVEERKDPSDADSESELAGPKVHPNSPSG